MLRRIANKEGPLVYDSLGLLVDMHKVVVPLLHQVGHLYETVKYFLASYDTYSSQNIFTT